MNMHPYVAGTIAAAQREARKCREALQHGSDPYLALSYAINVSVYLEEAIKLDEQFGEKEEG